MRPAYELNGNFISIDATKRQQYHLHWPYIGPVFLDDSKTIAVSAEKKIKSCLEWINYSEVTLSSGLPLSGQHPWAGDGRKLKTHACQIHNTYRPNIMIRCVISKLVIVVALLVAAKRVIFGGSWRWSGLIRSSL